MYSDRVRLKYTLLLLKKPNQPLTREEHSLPQRTNYHLYWESEPQGQLKHLIKALKINCKNRQSPQVLNGQRGKALEPELKSVHTTADLERQHKHRTQQGKHIQTNGFRLAMFSWNNQTHLKQQPINFKSTNTIAWISQFKDLLR